MKAAVAQTIGSRFELVDLAVADPIGHEVHVEVRASGLCHSDINEVRTGLGLQFPVVCGHEVAGVVTQTGPDVKSIESPWVSFLPVSLSSERWLG